MRYKDFPGKEKSAAGEIVSRRQFLRRLAINTGVGTAAAAITLSPPVSTRLLDLTSHVNDIFQSKLYSEKRLAQTYSQTEVTHPFPYNGYLPEAYVPRLDPGTWSLRVHGRVSESAVFQLDQISRLPKFGQTTRLICIEGWSAVGHWAGTRLSDLLRLAGADTSAKYVVLRCADDYHTSIDMASALQPQSVLAYEFLNRPLPPAFGAPLRLRIPTKLGFKNAKFLTSIEVTNRFHGGFWEDQGYNWFAGL